MNLPAPVPSLPTRIAHVPTCNGATLLSAVVYHRPWYAAAARWAQSPSVGHGPSVPKKVLAPQQSKYGDPQVLARGMSGELNILSDVVGRACMTEDIARKAATL